MLTYVAGDLFTSPAHVIVNTVNTVGVMGKGIAKTFKTIYPDMFKEYQRVCEAGELVPGSLHLYKTPHKWILNFPTKRHWRNRSRIDDIDAGLCTFVEQYRELGISSIAFPQLGCGNGELDWEREVRPVMERWLSELPIDVYIHIYQAGSLIPEHRDVDAMKAWLRSEPALIAFDSFLADLREVVAAQTISVSDVNRGSPQPSPLGESPVILHDRDRQFVLEKEDLFDFWQRFRAQGFIGRDELPHGLVEACDSVFHTLVRLSYVEPVAFRTLSRQRDDDQRQSTAEMLADRTYHGLRLVSSAYRGGRIRAPENIVEFGAWQPSLPMSG